MLGRELAAKAFCSTVQDKVRDASISNRTCISMAACYGSMENLVVMIILLLAECGIFRGEPERYIARIQLVVVVLHTCHLVISYA